MKEGIQEISAGLGSLLERAETLLEGVDDEKARETLQRLGKHLRKARSELADGARKVDGAVHSHPWQALVLTAIVSFFAGMLVRRR